MLDRRKGILNIVAEDCANAVRDRWRREESKARILRAWKRYKAEKQLPKVLDEESLVRSVAKAGVEEMSGDETDIWLAV